uniref:Uncharacterized protein n=1 Tax=Opuntia streptacantha TaxID=393608 RepID=A0A7C9DYB2_OPUST
MGLFWSARVWARASCVGDLLPGYSSPSWLVLPAASFFFFFLLRRSLQKRPTTVGRPPLCGSQPGLSGLLFQILATTAARFSFGLGYSVPHFRRQMSMARLTFLFSLCGSCLIVLLLPFLPSYSPTSGLTWLCSGSLALSCSLRLGLRSLGLGFLGIGPRKTERGRER